MSHSPTPWRADVSEPLPGREFVIRSADDRSVARYVAFDDHLRFAHETAEPVHVAGNAEFIVRAVNCHDELVAALKESLAMINRQSDFNDDGDGEMKDRMADAIKKAEAMS